MKTTYQGNTTIAGAGISDCGAPATAAVPAESRFFRDRYIRWINASLVEAQRRGEGAVFAEIARSLTRSCPQNVWQRLNGPQRLSRVASAWGKAVSTGRDGAGFTETDFAQLAYPEAKLSAKAAEVMLQLERLTCHTATNPTWNELAAYVAKTVARGEPLRIYVSQCLDKDPAVIAAKDKALLNPGGEKVEIEQFSRGVKVMGLHRLELLAQKLGYPCEVVLLLGDMDYYSVFRCDTYCSASSLERLDREMEQRRQELQEKAGKIIVSAPVQVIRWSDLYDTARFNRTLGAVQEPSNWCNRERVLTESREMYLVEWKFGDWGRRMGLDPAQLSRFVDDEIERTAAQYNLEARLLQERGGIIAWAEKTPKPIWPVEISNYDGATPFPSLFLVKD